MFTYSLNKLGFVNINSQYFIQDITFLGYFTTVIDSFIQQILLLHINFKNPIVIKFTF